MKRKTNLLSGVVAGLIYLLWQSQSYAIQVTRQFHFDFAFGNSYITSASGIDYSPIIANGFDFTATFDDAGTTMHSFDLSTPPQIFQTFNLQDYSGHWTVFSDAQISNSMLSLIDSSGFSPWSDRPISDGLPNDHLYSQYIQNVQHTEQFIDNQRSSYFNITVYSGDIQADNAFYWTKNGQEYIDRVVGWGYLTGEQGGNVPVPEPATMLLFGLSIAGVVVIQIKRKNR